MADRRKMLGMTQQQVAERAGITRGHYANLERGHEVANIETWKRIRSVFEQEQRELVEEHRREIARLEALERLRYEYQ